MSDFLTVTMHRCVSHLGVFHVLSSSRKKVYDVAITKQGVSCTCPAFRFARMGKGCKHIMERELVECGWNEQFDGQKAWRGDDGRLHCPMCQGDVETMEVGI